MSLTSEDIQAQQFHVRFRGFDVEEVDAFLERIAEDFLLLSKENQQVKEQVKNLTKEIDSYKTRERTFQDAILTAQKVADEMKRKSREEADETLTKAREKADEILTRASDEARRIEEDANAEITQLETNLDRLKADKTGIVDELRNFLKTNLENLENEKPLSRIAEAPPPDIPDELRAAKEPEIHNGGSAESAEHQETQDDLSDLYEKIDLDDMGAPESQVPEVQDAGQNSPETAVDLDGEMSFSLEDPLDEHEPSVIIDKD